MAPSYTGFVLDTGIATTGATTSGWTGLPAAGPELGAPGGTRPRAKGRTQLSCHGRSRRPKLQLLPLDVPKKIKFGTPVQPVLGRQELFAAVRNVPVTAGGGHPRLQK